MSIKKDILWRIYLAFFAVCCMGCTILYKAVKIDTVEGAQLRALSDSTTLAYEPIEAERGNILSDDGRLLATSLPYFEIRMDVSAVGLTNEVFNDKVDSLAKEMSAFFKDRSTQSYKQELITARRNGIHSYLIKKDASYPEMQAIKSWPILKMGRYKGGLLTWSMSHRVMPFRSLAKRTIGYVRGDSIQPVGLEGSFDEQLSGVKGKRLVQKIAGGTRIPVNDEDEIRSENGKDIVTTIDVNLQDVLENALRSTLVKNNAEHGCAILMEVATGKIKAIANLRRMSEGVYDEVLNHAVGEADEPGSTFKLASAIALLEDKMVKLSDSVEIAGGQAVFYDKVMHDSEDHHVGKVTVKHAFEISSNVAFAKLVDKYYSSRPEKFTQHLLELGLYNKTGVEIKGEADPFIRQPNATGWNGTTLPWMAVGYGIQETPLQILALYNAIANDGFRVKPYLIKEIQQQGKVIKSFQPEVGKKRICSEETLKKVKSMMEGVVTDGTGTAMQSPFYTVAGKTGTAQVFRDGHYNGLHRGSFVGYFPADKPAYSCIVVVSEPSNGAYYGGVVAGPVFKEVADKVYATSLQLHNQDNITKQYKSSTVPDMKSGNRNDAETICKELAITASPENEAPFMSIQTLNGSIVMKEQHTEEGMVPNVMGMGLRDALYLLENQGLVVAFSGKGKVKNQSINAGTEAVRGQTINIELN